MTKVIVDTDPGTDDALALMMALRSPGLDVLAITTVGGNARAAHTTRNALRLLHALDRTNIPVYKGAARPLKGAYHYAYYFHGAGGLTVRLPKTSLQARPKPADQYLAEAARALEGELVVIALGPLTNVARALALEPRLPRLVRRIVVMGGAVTVPGNVTPTAEFNVYNDPAAASLVFASGAPIWLVGLDVCDRVVVRRQDRQWHSVGSPLHPLAACILRNWFCTHPDQDTYSLCDPLAMAAAIRPALLTYRTASLQVETQDLKSVAKTRAAWGAGSIHVAVDVQAKEALRAIWALLAVPT